MIEITESQAVALSAALKILKTLGFADPAVWVRGIETRTIQGFKRVRVLFLIGRGPTYQRSIDIEVSKTQEGSWVPMYAFLMKTTVTDDLEEDSRWGFNLNHDPVQVR